MIKRLSLFMLSSFVILLLAGCQSGKDEAKKKDEKKEKKEEALPVEVIEVSRGSIEAVLEATANLEAEAEVKVYARTSNPVVELMVEEGDQVEKGQVLLRLLNDTQTIQVDKAIARLEKAQKDYRRQEDLFKKELITQQSFNDISYELKQAEIQLREGKQELDYTLVNAPISGTVTRRNVKLGDQVNINQHLFDIVDFNSLVARVYLPEKNLVKLEVGQPTRIGVQAMGDKLFSGSILRIAPTVDPGTGTVKVTVKVNEIGHLRPGMYVDVSLVLETHEDTNLIPKRALVYDNDQVFVFRVTQGKNEETRAERLLLEPVLMDKMNVEPGPTLNEGDRIVIAGQTGLKDQALLKILNHSQETPPTDSSAGKIEVNAQ